MMSHEKKNPREIPTAFVGIFHLERPLKSCKLNIGGLGGSFQEVFLARWHHWPSILYNPVNDFIFIIKWLRFRQASLNSILTTKMFHKNASLEDPCFKYRWRWYRASTRLLEYHLTYLYHTRYKVFNTSKSIAKIIRTINLLQK